MPPVEMVISVKIPTQKTAVYSLYAEGVPLGFHELPLDEVLINFIGNIGLFYTFPQFRIAYIVTATQDYDGVILPGIVKNRVKILYEARGRQIDVLKQTLFYLKTKEERIMQRCPLFFYELGALIDAKSVKKYNLTLLMERHNVDCNT